MRNNKNKGQEIIQRTSNYHTRYVELENGIFLEDMKDGRYYNSEDEFDKWAEVEDAEFNQDGEYLSGQTLGFVRV